MTTTATPAKLHGPRATDPFFYGWRYVTKSYPDGTTVSEQVPLTEWDVLHPQEEDFIVHSALHDTICYYLKGAFLHRLADTPGAVVLHDHRIDWQVAGILPHGPDVTVLLNSDPWDHRRGTFPVRDQHADVAFVVEVTSPSTRNTDLLPKVQEYFQAGIPLYVIVDLIESDDMPGIRLVSYRPTPDGPVAGFPDDRGRLWLPTVDLWLHADGDDVYCTRPDGRRIGDYVDVARQVEQATERVEQERLRAEQERQRAEQERQRADALAAQMHDLEAELRRLRGDRP